MRAVSLLLFLYLCLHGEAPKLFSLKVYHDDLNVTGWVMSEKLDGVRAYWNGKQLISRSGKVFNPPQSFTQGFPSFALDGEIWSRRGEFEHIVSIVNSKGSNEGWAELSYNIFEVPHQKGGLLQRLNILEEYLHTDIADKLSILKQTKIKNAQQVKLFFDKVIAGGGEGIVLRDPDEPYYTGRTSSALKHKPFTDAECKITAVIEGKGKFSGQLGAVKCDYKGKIIKIGSGFTSEQRKNSFDIGTVVSFKYYGLTHLGNPKYPVFLRVRSDADLNWIGK
jgi:DNA ligase